MKIFNGASDGDTPLRFVTAFRTPGFNPLINQLIRFGLHQNRLSKGNGASDGDRTHDQRYHKPLLYH